MHSVMVLCAQRNQVPVGIPILRILIRRPAMVNNACRLRDRLVSAALAAKVLISPKDPLPLVQPAFFLVIHWAITSNPTQKNEPEPTTTLFCVIIGPGSQSTDLLGCQHDFRFYNPCNRRADLSPPYPDRSSEGDGFGGSSGKPKSRSSPIKVYH